MNSAPTDILLDDNTVPENSANGTLVGHLSAVDPDGDASTFFLLDNAGGRFSLSGNSLMVANGGLLDFETLDHYNVIVRATDPFGATFDKNLAVQLINANDGPTNHFTQSLFTPEDTSIVTALLVSDPDAVHLDVELDVTHGTVSLGQTTGLSFITGDGNTDPTVRFSGTIPDLNAALAAVPFIPDANYFGQATIEFTTRDHGETGVGSPLADRDYIAINVSAVADPPSDIKLSTVSQGEDLPPRGGFGTGLDVEENQAGPVAIGYLSAVEPDDPTHSQFDYSTFSIVDDPDSLFTITTYQSSNGEVSFPVSYLSLVGPIDYEQAASHSVTIHAVDIHGFSVDKTFTLNVVNVDPEYAAGGSGPDHFVGGNLNDVFYGNGGNDILDGQGGPDFLNGGDGFDSLYGGDGDDTLDSGANPDNQGDIMLGGRGNDTYIVDSSLDLVDEGSAFPGAPADGIDTIISKADFFWDVYSAGDVIRIDETAADPQHDGTTVIGSMFSNFLFGNSHDNVLFGRGGSDTYVAGDGIDYISLSTLGLTDGNSYAGVDGVNTVIVDPRQSGPYSYDIIFEFDPSKDKIDVSRYSGAHDYTSGDEVLTHAVDDDIGNCYIVLGDGLDYVYLVGLEKADLNASDFIV